MNKVFQFVIVACCLAAVLWLLFFSPIAGAPKSEFDDYTLSEAYNVALFRAETKPEPVEESIIAEVEGGAVVEEPEKEAPRPEITFERLWILRSATLDDLLSPNKLRGKTTLLMDTDNEQAIREMVKVAGSFTGSYKHVRLLPKGEVFHVLMFDKDTKQYAHLRFMYRSKQRDNSVVFMLSAQGAKEKLEKDCPNFELFQVRWLNKKKKERLGSGSDE